VLGAAIAGCSSSGSTGAPAGTTASSTAASSTAASSAVASKPAVPVASADPADGYLNAVNALCGALLPKIVTVTHGGSIDVPAHEYLATWPAHKRLLDGFDAHLAAVPVPASAHREAATLTAYVRFADRLDAARLAAAHQGQAAYAREVRSESGAANDPTISALAAAGFNSSCTAR
jgi:hypothetical protein